MSCLKLIVLNMCLWPVGLRQCWSDTNKDNRLKSLLSLLLDENSQLGTADVVCLQEFFDSVYSYKFTQQLKKSLMGSVWHIATGPDPSWKTLCTRGCLLNSGLIILSKHEFLTVRFESFEHNPGLMGWMNAGFLHVQLKLASSIDIINCHLYPDEGHSDAKSIREKQLNELQEYTQQLHNKVAIAGDFNIHQSSDEYKYMTQLLETEEEAIIPSNEVTMHNCQNWADHQQCITSDYALGKNGVYFGQTKILYDAVYVNLSDHYPILTHLLLKEKA